MWAKVAAKHAPPPKPAAAAPTPVAPESPVFRGSLPPDVLALIFSLVFQRPAPGASLLVPPHKSYDARNFSPTALDLTPSATFLACAHASRACHRIAWRSVLAPFGGRVALHMRPFAIGEPEDSLKTLLCIFLECQLRCEALVILLPTPGALSPESLVVYGFFSSQRALCFLSCFLAVAFLLLLSCFCFLVFAFLHA